MKTETKKCCDTIISYQTTPPQIDYIPPSEKEKVTKAQEYIDSLPTDEKEEAENYISEQVESYYGEDENGVSPAYLDSLF
jgi:hypothetical protein